MDSPEKIVDVKGVLIEGEKGYFENLARNNPEKSYVLIGPEVPVKEHVSLVDRLFGKKKPDNLNTINWESNEESNLPLKENSVDHVYMNLVFGGISSKERRLAAYDGSTDTANQNAYKHLLEDVKRILKNGGKIQIVDFGVFPIETLLQQAGFKSIENNPFSGNSVQTDWTKFYGDKQLEWTAFK
jgi:nucleoid DNA-binding protein